MDKIEKDIIFFSESKGSQSFFSFQNLRVRSSEPKGVDLRFQYRHQGSHNEHESYSNSPKNMIFFAKQPEQLVYKGGPVSSQKKYLKSLMIEQHRYNMSSAKEEQSLYQRIKQEESPPVDQPKIEPFKAEQQERSSGLYFFQQPYEIPYSKLLWFKPNVKNGRNIVYNPEKMRCQPVFKCEGCLKKFELPSALGGHLSRCEKKHQHFRSIAPSYPKINLMSKTKNLGKKKLTANYQEEQIQQQNSNEYKEQEAHIFKKWSIEIKMQEIQSKRYQQQILSPRAIKRSNRIKKMIYNKRVKKIKTEESFQESNDL